MARARKSSPNKAMAAQKKAFSTRAWVAMRRLQRQIPALTKFARAVTRNPTMEVRATPETPYTDGKVIYLRPPMRMGDNIPHSVGSCGRRDPVLRRQVCEACWLDDLLKGYLYHELAHNAYGSLVIPTPAGRRPVIQLINEWHPADVCDHAADKVVDAIGAVTYLSVINEFDGRLVLLLNALEDIRVNALMMRERPGTRPMIEANYIDVLENGSENAYGDVVHWSSMPPDAQVCIGLMLLAGGYEEFLDRLDPSVQAVLQDDELANLASKVSTAEDAHELTGTVVSIWRRLNDLGFVVVEKCQPTNEDATDEDSEDDDDEDSKDDEAEDGDDDPGELGSLGNPGQSSPSAGQGSGGGQGKDQQESTANDDDPGENNDSQSGPGQTGTDGDSEGDGESDDSEEDLNDGEDDEASDDRGEAEASESSGEAERGGADGEPADAESEGGSTGNTGDVEPEPEPKPEPATLEELKQALRQFSIHTMFEEKLNEAGTATFAVGEDVLVKLDSNNSLWEEALKGAIKRAAWFDGPSETVAGVQVVTYPSEHPEYPWTPSPEDGWTVEELAAEQSVVGPIVNKGAIVFAANRKTRYEGGLRSGKINVRAIPRQVPFDGDKIFRRKTVPAKRSYHVVITMDISGSTASVPNSLYSRRIQPRPGERRPCVLNLAQRAVFAQAEALHRLGISFEIWAHTAGGNSKTWDTEVWMFQVKTPEQAWNPAARERLANLVPQNGNLDGHTLQYVRKRAELMAPRFTQVIVCYYTDGAMPAMNAEEEGRMLKDETAYCKQRGIPLLAVGIETDSPQAWGFDTVQIDGPADYPKVMAQLERYIL